MLAAVYHEPGDIRLEERPYPALVPGSMIARVLCCALCGTDLKLATIGHPRCHPPRIIGHETVGRIEELGTGVRGFEPGQRITLATTVACGSSRTAPGDWATSAQTPCQSASTTTGPWRSTC